MRVLDAEAPLTVAHTVPDDFPTAQPAAVGLFIRPRRRGAQTACGLDVGRAWVDAEPYAVPDCPDCTGGPAPDDGQEALL